MTPHRINPLKIKYENIEELEEMMLEELDKDVQRQIEKKRALRSRKEADAAKKAKEEDDIQ